MEQRLSIEFFDLLKIALISPMAGWMFTICLFEIMQKVFSYEFPKTTYKKRKRTCWLYLSIAVVAMALLIKAFTH